MSSAAASSGTGTGLPACSVRHFVRLAQMGTYLPVWIRFRTHFLSWSRIHIPFFSLIRIRIWNVLLFLSNPFSSFFLIEFSFLSVKCKLGAKTQFSGQLQPIFPKVIFLFKSPRSLVKLDQQKNYCGSTALLEQALYTIQVDEGSPARLILNSLSLSH